MRDHLTNLLGLLLLGACFALGCGGLLIDNREADAAILRWTGR